MADRDRERVRLVRRRGLVGEREEHSDHPRDLSLVRPPVAAHRLLHPRRRVLGARDARGRGRDERGAPCLPDEERDAGVGTDEGLLQRDGVRLVLGMSVPTPSKIRLSRSSGRSLAPDVQHPWARALIRPPRSWTIPYPHAAVPGSMPRTFT